MHQTLRRLTALLLSVCLLALCAGCGVRAATMHLRRADGDVAVTNDKGSALTVAENLSLYDGYGVGTQAASYAWIDLDNVKLTKLDENSAVTIQRAGKALTVELAAGSLFFNVVEPLAADETLEIRTASMMVGIRGTCGWVTADGYATTVALLQGAVTCQPLLGQAVTLTAGQKAVQPAGSNTIYIENLTAADVPAFVQGEADELLATLGSTPGGTGGRDTVDISDIVLPEGVGNVWPDGQLPAPADDGVTRTVIEVADGPALEALVNSGDDLSNTEIRLTGSEYRCGGLYLYGYDNLSIIGDGAHIYSTWGDDTILSANSCHNLLLQGLVMGHDLMPEASCSAGVVNVENSTGVQVVGCDLYGCGLVGLAAYNAEVTLQYTTVRDCSQYALDAYASTVRLENCTVSGNGLAGDANMLFHLSEDDRITLERCALLRNASVERCGGYFWDEENQSSVFGIPESSSFEQNDCYEVDNDWQGSGQGGGLVLP